MLFSLSRDSPVLFGFGRFFWGGPAFGLVVAGLMVCAGVAEAKEDPVLRMPEVHFPVLEEVLREAAGSADRILEENLTVEIAEADAEVAASGRYPSISATVRYLGRLEDRSDLSGTRSYFDPQATLLFRQPLYHWGALDARRDFGELGAELSKVIRAEVFRALSLEIRRAFLGLAIQRKAIVLAEEQWGLAVRELEAAELRLEEREGTRQEVREFRLVADEAELRLAREKEELQFAVAEFRRLSGFLGEERDWIPETVPDLGRLPEPVLVETAGELPWREISDIRIRQAEKSVVIEKARQRPRLDLIAGVSQDQFATSQRSDVGRVVYFGGVELSWNLFDGHETRGRREAAVARRELEVMRLERREIEKRNRLEKLRERLGWTDRELGIAEGRLGIAGEKVAEAESDLAKGLVSEIEVVARRVELREKELAVVRLRVRRLMEEAEFLSESGHDPVVEFLE